GGGRGHEPDTQGWAILPDRRHFVGGDQLAATLDPDGGLQGHLKEGSRGATVWPSRHAPPPLGHRRFGIDRRTRLRIEYGQARSPFEIGHQGGAELWVVRQARLVSRLEQQAHPLEPLRLRETAVEVTGDHVRMPTALLAVRGR